MRTRFEHWQGRIVRQALRTYGDNVSAAARWLGISRSRLYRLIHLWGLRHRKVKPRPYHGFCHDVRFLIGIAPRKPLKRLTEAEKEDLWHQCRVAWHNKLMIHHPDHGGSAEKCMALNAAYNRVTLRLRPAR